MPRSEFITYEKKSNFRKTEFIKLTPGKHLIRFLQPDKYVFDTHYVKGWTVACPGDGCPVCESNTRIRMEDPKNFYRNPGYVPVRQIGVTNVLDRTPAKVCPNCGTEHKKSGTTFPTACSKCNNSLVSVKAEPLNKVKVVSKGKRFFDQIDTYKATVLDEETQTPIDFTTYDFTVIVTNDEKSTPVLDPNLEHMDVVEVSEEDLFDLDNAVMQLSVEEFTDLLRGMQLRDILKARGATKKEETAPVSSNYKQSIDEMFDN